MENKIYGYVYLITNLINGKQYVGQTVRTIKKRFKSHFNEAKQKITYIGRAINKYGKENFVIQEIAIAYNQEQLTFLEGIYMSWFNTLSPNGYNTTKIINGKGKSSKETIKKLKIVANTQEKLKISSENGKKTRGKSLGGSSKYCGVCSKNNKYLSRIVFNNKTIHIGVYSSETDAAKAYDIKALELFGNDCNLNFPELRNQYIKGCISIIKRCRIDFSKSKEDGIRFDKSRQKSWVFSWFDKTLNKNKSKYFESLKEAIEFKKEIYNNKNCEKFKKYIKSL